MHRNRLRAFPAKIESFERRDLVGWQEARGEAAQAPADPRDAARTQETKLKRLRFDRLFRLVDFAGSGVFRAPAASKSSRDDHIALRSSPCRITKSVPSNRSNLRRKCSKTLGRTASVFALALGAACATPAAAERYAVLVGVTKYPNLPPKNWLVGPANDAALMRTLLVNEAGFDAKNVTVLADDTEGAASSPTHDAIRSTLKAMADKVGKDDFVYLHFGGHGFQQPALDPASETDGKDEIFLPSDTMMPGPDKRLPNAYIDDEVKADLDAIRAKGAFVWVVFDACHSSTATRAALGGDEMERKIDWSDLGVEPPTYPEEGSRAVGEERESSLSAEEKGAAAEPGGLVAFYAAQTVETTPEMPLPADTEGAPRQGLFSYTIARELAANPNVTYRQLGEAVLQDYSALNRTRPTPMFEGDLDKQVFNNTSEARVLQWKVASDGAKATIPAGNLHRLAPGAKLAIMAKPGDAVDAALGFVVVKSTTNFESTLAEVPAEAAGGKPVITLAEIPKDAFARVVETPVDFKLTVARPDAAKYPAEAAALDAALDRIVKDGKVAINLDVVDAGKPADLRFAVLSEKDIDPKADSTEPLAWFLPPNGEVSLAKGLRPASIALTAPTATTGEDPLASTLVKIYRATNLSRLAAANDFSTEELAVSFTLKRAGGEEVAIEGGQVPVARPDDIIHVNAVNNSGKAVDVNVLYIGSDNSIGQMYAERLQPGSKVSDDVLQFTAESFGIERMIVVLNEATAGSNVEDLSFLEQTGTPREAGTRGAGSDGLMAMLEDIGGGAATRGAMKIGGAKARKGAVIVVPVETAPATQ